MGWGGGGGEGGRPRDSAPITAIYHRRASDWLPRRPMAGEGNFAEKMDPRKGLGNFCLPLDNCLCLLATEVWIYRASGTCGYYSVDTLMEDPSGLERINFFESAVILVLKVSVFYVLLFFLVYVYVSYTYIGCVFFLHILRTCEQLFWFHFHLDCILDLFLFSLLLSYQSLFTLTRIPQFKPSVNSEYGFFSRKVV